MPILKDRTLRNIDIELWDRAKVAAIKEKKSLYAWVQEAIVSYLKKGE